jgi:TolB-like protein/Flp pilus assembly protein TadD
VKGFLRELHRRRVFRTAALYVVGAWLVMQVADVLFPGWGLPDAAINIVFIAAVLGFPLALVFGWFFDVTAQGILRTPSTDKESVGTPLTLRRRDYVLLAALVAVGVAILSDATREILESPRHEGARVPGLGKPVLEEKLPNSIAVLPFANMSNDPGNEYFCDGVSEEILNRLGSYSALNVIGRTSSFAFKGSDYPLRRIGDLLGARYLLQGSVRKQDDRLRISAQLLDETGTQLWSDSFDRTLGDIFSIQAQIAEVVAATVVPRIAGPAALPYEPPLEAYQSFLAGRELLRRRQPIEQVRNQLQKAVDLDPQFAAAYAELAIAYVFHSHDAQDIAIAREALDTALRLEPGMPRALAARAFLLQQQDDPDWAVSEIVLREALAKDPNMVDALNWLSIALGAQEKTTEAAAIMEQAARLDPLHGAVAANAAQESAHRGDFETAERRLRRLLEIPQPPINAYEALRDFYWNRGRLVDMNSIAKQQALTVGFHYMGLSMSYALLALWDRSSYWAKRTMIDMPNWFWAKYFGPTSLSYWQGRYRDSLDEWDQALAGAGKPLAQLPDKVALSYGEGQALAGDFDGAIRTLEPLIGPPRPINYGEFGWVFFEAVHALAWSYQEAGLAEKSALILRNIDQQLEKRQREGILHESHDLFLYARNALLMGDHDRALDLLEQAVDAGWRDYYVQRHDPRWTVLSTDARYQALMDKVKTDVDRQRAEVERIDAAEDFIGKLDAAIAARRGSGR